MARLSKATTSSIGSGWAKEYMHTFYARRGEVGLRAEYLSSKASIALRRYCFIYLLGIVISCYYHLYEGYTSSRIFLIIVCRPAIIAYRFALVREDHLSNAMYFRISHCRITDAWRPNFSIKLFLLSRIIVQIIIGACDIYCFQLFNIAIYHASSPCTNTPNSTLQLLTI